MPDVLKPIQPDATTALHEELTAKPETDLAAYYKSLGPAQDPPKTIQFPEAAQLSATPAAPTAAAPKGTDGALDGGTSIGKDVTNMAEGAAKTLGHYAQNIWNAGIDTLNHVSKFAQGHGVTTGDLIDPSNKVDWQQFNPKPGDPVAMRLGQGLMQYALPVAATMGTGLPEVAAAALAGGIDYATLDPHQERLSNLVQEKFPEMKNVAVIGQLTNYLANHEGESDAEGRFKNMIEGLGVGFGMIGAFHGAGMAFRGAQRVSNMTAQYLKAGTQAAEEAAPAAGATVTQLPESSASVLKESTPEQRQAYMDWKQQRGTTPLPGVEEDQIYVHEMQQRLDQGKITDPAERAEAQKNIADTIQKLNGDVGDFKGYPTEGDPAHPLSPENQAKVASVRDSVMENATPLINPDAPEGSVFSSKTTQTGSTGEVLPNINHDETLKALSKIAANISPLDLVYVQNNKEMITDGMMNILKDPDRVHDMLMKVLHNEASLSPEEHAAATILVSKAHQSFFENATRAAATGDKEALASFAESINSMVTIQGVLDKSGSQAGAALGVRSLLKDFTDAGKTISQAANDKDMANKIQILKHQGLYQPLVDGLNQFSGGEATLHEMAKKIQAVYDLDPEAAAGKLTKILQGKQGIMSKISDTLNFTMINGMLSSLRTAGKLFPLQAIMTGPVAAADKIMAGAVGEVMSAIRPDKWGDGNQTMKQSLEFVHGQMQAWLEHFHSVGRALGMSSKEAENVATYKVDFANRPNPISASNYGIEDKLYGNIVDVAGQAFGVPGKIASAHDSWMGQIPYRGSLQEQALRAAETRGLKPDAIPAFVEKFLADPPVPAHETAKRAAQDYNQMGEFPNNDMGRFGQSFQKALNKLVPFGVGSSMEPFTKVGFNLAQFTYEHSPFRALLAPLSADIRAGLGQPGTPEFAMSMGKIANGTMMLAGATYLAHQGFITGHPPENYGVEKALKESNTGWQPDSVRVGDKYISVRGMEPLVSFMRMGALLANAHNYLEKGEYGQLVTAAAGISAQALSPEQFVQNNAQLMDMIQGVMGGGDERKHAVSQFVDEQVGKLIPFSAFVRDVRNATNRTAADTGVTSGPPLSMGVEKLKAATANRLPFFNKGLPVDRNVFAEPILLPTSLPKSEEGSWLDRFTSMVNPFTVSAGKSSEVHDAMKALAGYYDEHMPLNPDLKKLSVSMPSRNFYMNGTNLPLTPQEYERYVMYGAGISPDTGETLGRETLREKMERLLVPLHAAIKEGSLSEEDYNRQIGHISQAIAESRQEAKKYMLQDPAFHERWTKAVNATQATPVSANVMN